MRSGYRSGWSSQGTSGEPQKHCRPYISRNTPNLYRWCVQSTINSILPWFSFPAFLEASLAPRWKWKGRLSRRNMKVVYIFPDLTISWLNLSSWHKSSHYLFQAALRRSTTSHRHHLRRTGDRKYSKGCCKVSSMNQTASFKVTNQMYYIKSNRLSVWDMIKAYRPVYMYNDQMSVKSS